ncbi:MAG: ABC transporter ATP-binding protein [Bacteroidia bacterium]|nr:ABC transporter ATP-binding protein [Bacteroidota bacterium]MBP6427048.1 ABC transporter ATP-binding protein [Bacteroidia bacterium]MBP6657218.1 ABC transporter ATP-binding protein [Bacteroidia bacterium]
MKPILEVQNISKKFRIYHEHLPYESMRSKLMNPLSFFSKKESEEFWALKNVSFSVNAGESIGIIGKNGAGKSTLLKVLSKITPPTEGKIISRGRIASLLEVGTGFHPELTGRENVFLNGSILGMKKKEIQQQFDEIIDFAGIEKFLDTQLKHYSSGMQLRLAFAVAAFLNPEIMIIDEVLAVGDADFQKKCIGKMEGVTRSGRTILFVSHQMGLVNQLCSRALLMSKGEILVSDSTDIVTSKYLSFDYQESENVFTHDPKLTANKEMYIEHVSTVDGEHKPSSVFGFNQEIRISFVLVSNNKVSDEILSVALQDKYGNRIFTIHKPLDQLARHENRIRGSMLIPKEFIAPNIYSFHFAIVRSDGKVFDIHEGQCRFRVADTGTPFSQYEGKDYGNIIISCKWESI